MDDEDGSYAPESPDASAYEQIHLPPQVPYDPYAPHSSSYGIPAVMPELLAGSFQPPTNYNAVDGDWLPTTTPSRPKRKQGQTPVATPPPPSTPSVEVKTKFPVARIKRIMQADEDVGKVAQVTPVVVSKALEIFMIALVTRAADEAKTRLTKRVTASHLKQAVQRDEQYDFLQDIIAKVPDAPAPAPASDEPKPELGSDEAGPENKRKRIGGRKKRRDSDAL
ncbi:MAG: hypothetical protein M1825_001492 [Sarcosagium campestre]|nr:MAG: hypothetical protein M1825_001492 [Sarcosagium campestre]